MCVNAGEKMHQRAGVKLHQDGMPKASTGGLLLGDKQDEKRIASPENVPQASSVASPRACSRCLTGLLAEPQLPFSIPIQNASLMLALWSCGRRAGVVQAQRQIHRAFAGQLRRHLRTSSHASC
jgi:hypothetical protein